MRAMGAFFGAGLMDRYANLRFAVLESGFAGSVLGRPDEPQASMGSVAEGQHTSGAHQWRAFLCLIVLHEGGKMVKLVSVMLVTNFVQHRLSTRESLPGSVDPALSWPEVHPELMQKILWVAARL